MIHKKVSKHVTKEKTLANGVEIWKGLTIQCKQHFKAKDGSKTFVNNLYRIDGISKFIKIVDMSDEGIVFNMERQQLWKTFSLSYCNTCHAEQGCSINEGLTIFDANTPYVNRYWLYTAITRARDLAAITIFIHSDKEVRSLEASKLKQYINHKIEGYKEQDTVAGRGVAKDYCDWEWFSNEFKKCTTCFHCQKSFEFKLDDDNFVNSDLTFDRLDDSLGHTKDNLVLSCKHCNCCKIKY